MKIHYLIPIVVFVLGVTLSFLWNLPSNQELSEAIVILDWWSLYKKIVLNNYLVCLILVAGFLTFGIASVVIIVYNGFVFGVGLQVLAFEKIGYYFLSYSILESLSFIVACQIGLNLSLSLFKNIVSEDSHQQNLKLNAIKAVQVIVIVQVAAIVEVYVSIN